MVLEALLTYWLSWFLLPRMREDGLKAYVFPLAILFAKGQRLALALIYLGCMFARLYE